MILESLPESRKTGNRWKMAWQFIPNVWSNRREWFGLCHSGFSRRDTKWQERGGSQWSCRHIPWNKGGKIRWLLELQNLECDSSNLEIYSATKNVLYVVPQIPHNKACIGPCRFGTRKYRPVLLQIPQKALKSALLRAFIEPEFRCLGSWN